VDVYSITLRDQGNELICSIQSIPAGSNATCLSSYTVRQDDINAQRELRFQTFGTFGSPNDAQSGAFQSGVWTVQSVRRPQLFVDIVAADCRQFERIQGNFYDQKRYQMATASCRAGRELGEIQVLPVPMCLSGSHLANLDFYAADQGRWAFECPITLSNLGNTPLYRVFVYSRQEAYGPCNQGGKLDVGAAWNCTNIW
jgi:hypothetical protein